jgi:hypothetical protein
MKSFHKIFVASVWGIFIFFSFVCVCCNSIYLIFYDRRYTDDLRKRQIIRESVIGTNEKIQRLKGPD